MSCPYCGANDEEPSCANYVQYTCGSRYDDGDYIQSAACKVDLLEKRVEKLELLLRDANNS